VKKELNDIHFLLKLFNVMIYVLFYSCCNSTAPTVNLNNECPELIFYTTKNIS